MGNYTTVGHINAIVRSIFGLLLALGVLITLKSVFLSILTVAVLAFWPINNEKEEKRWNGIVFAFVMAVLLFWAFIGGYGLDLDLGLSEGWSVTTGIVLVALIGLLWIRFSYLIPDYSGRTGRAPLNMKILNMWIIGLVILFLFVSSPWTWKLSAVIFITLWIITLLAGLMGGLQTRQSIGIIMILISFFIYTFGVGSDQVGAAAFGDWWPQVKDTGKNVLGPLVDSVKNMFSSFKEAISMITCPTCAARSILDGIYANPTGKGQVGSYGLEFEELSVPDGKLNLGRPFSVTMGVKNQGAKEINGATIDLLVNGKSSTEWLKTPQGQIPELPLTNQDLFLEDAKQFVTVGELSCTGIKEEDIIKNYIVPIKAVAKYGYSMDSQLSVEFISEKERDRLLREKKLERKKGKSTMTTSPLSVSLSMDLDQPVQEKTRFYVGLGVKIQEPDAISGPVKIKLKFPDGWMNRNIKVTGASEGDVNAEFGKLDLEKWYNYVLSGKEMSVDWVNEQPIQKYDEKTKTTEILIYNIPKDGVNLFFDFPQDTVKLSGLTTIPTKTFVMTAEAEFSVIKWKETSTKFEFGGFCCPSWLGLGAGKGCPSGQSCSSISGSDVGNCVGEEPVSTATRAINGVKPGDPGYCSEYVKPTNEGGQDKKCGIYMGGCDVTKVSNENECDQGLKCTDLGGFDACCPASTISLTPQERDDCLNKYRKWVIS